MSLQGVLKSLKIVSSSILTVQGKDLGEFPRAEPLMLVTAGCLWLFCFSNRSIVLSLAQMLNKLKAMASE